MIYLTSCLDGGAGNISNAVLLVTPVPANGMTPMAVRPVPKIDGFSKIPPADTFHNEHLCQLHYRILVLFLLFLAFFALGISTRSVHHGWSRRNICWFILLAYLYIQFESYAFYAIPLFIWAVCTIMNRGKNNINSL